MDRQTDRQTRGYGTYRASTAGVARVKIVRSKLTMMKNWQLWYRSTCTSRSAHTSRQWLRTDSSSSSLCSWIASQTALSALSPHALMNGYIQRRGSTKTAPKHGTTAFDCPSL